MNRHGSAVERAAPAPSRVAAMCAAQRLPACSTQYIARPTWHTTRDPPDSNPSGLLTYESLSIQAFEMPFSRPFHVAPSCASPPKRAQRAPSSWQASEPKYRRGQYPSAASHRKRRSGPSSGLLRRQRST